MKWSNYFVSVKFLMGLLCLGTLASCRQSDDLAVEISAPLGAQIPCETIRFGVYTADKATTVVEQFAPILEALESATSEKLGRLVHISLTVSASYNGGISDIVEGNVHFSRLGPASFVMAKAKNPDLGLLAMESKGGKRTFFGIIAVHKDSEIGSVTELKGKSFAFGDPLSTIGRYLAQSELLKHGIRGADLKRYDFLGRHDTVGMAIAAGDFSAGALKASTFDKLVADGEPLKILQKFKNVTKPWVSHPTLDAEVAAALQASILELDATSISKDGFLEADEKYYTPIQTAMKRAEEF